MIALDDDVAVAINASHIMQSRVTAFYGSQSAGVVSIVDGTVSFDETSDVQSRCSVKIPVTSVALPNVFDPRDLDVNGWRLFIEYGVKIGGTFRYTPLGLFVCYDLNDDDGPGGRLLTITGYDTTVLIRDGRFVAPYSVAAGTNYATAMTAMLTAINLSSSFPATGFTTPALLFLEGDDRLARLQDMTASLGSRAEADPYGVITSRTQVVSAASASVASFVEGEGSRMTAISRARTRQQVYNIGVVTGEPAGGTAPVYGIAYDDDPNSGTYYLGPFGQVPVFEKSQYVTTTDQAQAAALGLLSRKKGIGAALKIRSWPNPGLRPGDPVQVTRAKMGVDQVIPLKAVDIPLTPGQEMQLTTREGVTT
jgi:hypothetical protein